MAEFYGRGIAAVFAADAAVQVFADGLAERDRHIHQLANAGGIQPGKRIGLVDLVRVVRREELAGVVTAEAEGHLSKVVSTEAEELSLFSYFVSS